MAIAAAIVSGCGDATTHQGPTPPDGSIIDSREVQAGGDVTVARSDEKAFSQSAPALSFADEANFKSGNLIFRGVPRGLGPLLNAQSCQGCHEQDGRGNPPRSRDEPMSSLLLRLSVAGPDGLVPDPIYGDQLQTLGVDVDNPSEGLPRHDGALPREDAPFGDGAIGEGFAYIDTEEISGAYPDGEPYVLHRPIYWIRDLSYGPLDPSAVISPRMAPGMIGLGLLEAIPAEDIRAREDPDDRDRDGISGRANLVHEKLRGETRLGRFGWKASQPSILQQSAGAFEGDIGVTSSLFPNEPCTPEQAACLERARNEIAGDEPDVRDVALALVEFYSRHLAVPRRRGWNTELQTWEPQVLRGRELFFAANCVGCHVPMHTTGEAEGSLLGDVELIRLVMPSTPLAELSHQVIWPYTDLLLHDMGGECAPLARETEQGEPCEDGADCRWVQRCEGLADGRGDLLASGTEWRTPPLWGLGLTHTVNPDAGFLHDGRARSIEEAILWHGGEADASRRFFARLSREDRQAVLAFLESQ